MLESAKHWAAVISYCGFAAAWLMFLGRAVYLVGRGRLELPTRNPGDW